MNFAPGIAEFIAQSAAADAPFAVPVNDEQRRINYRTRCQAFARPLPAELAVADLAVPAAGRDIAIRVYRPAAAADLPGVLYLHGGGWVVGDLDSHNDVCAALALAVPAVVIAVDYRLAPEHPYPAALDDAYAVYQALHNAPQLYGLLPGRLAVSGDSAGGNLAAALALLLRDRGEPLPRLQALLYPALGVDFATPSYLEKAAAPMLTRADMQFYWQCYLGGQAADAYAAPLRAADLRGLPPAVIVTAEHDPLCDDGRLYAERLRAAGVAVEYRQFAGLVHGCVRARYLSADAQALVTMVAAALRDGL